MNLAGYSDSDEENSENNDHESKPNESALENQQTKKNEPGLEKIEVNLLSSIYPKSCL